MKIQPKIRQKIKMGSYLLVRHYPIKACSHRSEKRPGLELELAQIHNKDVWGKELCRKNESNSVPLIRPPSSPPPSLSPTSSSLSLSSPSSRPLVGDIIISVPNCGGVDHKSWYIMIWLSSHSQLKFHDYLLLQDLMSFPHIVLSHDPILRGHLCLSMGKSSKFMTQVALKVDLSKIALKVDLSKIALKMDLLKSFCSFTGQQDLLCWRPGLGHLISFY